MATGRLSGLSLETLVMSHAGVRVMDSFRRYDIRFHFVLILCFVRSMFHHKRRAVPLGTKVHVLSCHILRKK